MNQLPICEASPQQKETISHLVKTIYDDPPSSHVPAIESKINQIIYQLYDLTSEEIQIIEEATSG